MKPIFSVEGHLWAGEEDFSPPIQTTLPGFGICMTVD